MTSLGSAAARDAAAGRRDPAKVAKNGASPRDLSDFNDAIDLIVVGGMAAGQKVVATVEVLPKSK